MKASWLADRSVLRVAGPDAAHFLQNLLTNSVSTLAVGQATYAALLTPQGKIIADMIVIATADGFLLDLPASRLAEITKRLTLYKLRAAVTVTPTSDLRVLALWNAEAPAAPTAFPDPRLPDLGFRALVTEQQAGNLDAVIQPDSAWHSHRIMLGVPHGGLDFAYDEAFPHDADLDQLNGVDFRKGCYVGQEVVSRMEHRGTARSRIVQVRLSGGAPNPGTEIRAGERLIGTLGSSAGAHALAMVRLDRAEDALLGGEVLRAGEAELVLVKPSWARFRFPGDAPAAPHAGYSL